MSGCGPAMPLTSEKAVPDPNAAIILNHAPRSSAEGEEQEQQTQLEIVNEKKQWGQR